MKIAVVADIHANLIAFEQFRKEMDATGITTILNLGDFLQIGPHPVEVFDLITTDQRFINILGNNEIALFDRDLYLKKLDVTKEEIEHQEWNIGILEY